jgi:hypothetical protein
MRYWWVNHNQTSRQELEGGYLWSPIHEANGARSQFYDNMRLAEPGDPVLSFANGMISNVGVVVDYASVAPKPDSFGSTGDYWSDEGWLLPVSWRPLGEPVRPKDHIDQLGPLLPRKYSPIQPSTGNGNQKAYLAEVGEEVFRLMLGLDESDGPFEPPTKRQDEPMLARIDAAVERLIADDPTVDATVKQQLVSSRRGQGLFRARIFEYGDRCRLTGIENPRFLIASHIKPWRVCDSAKERLDGANGLLLAPHVDFLFDKGYLGFADAGDVLVSSRLARVDLRRFGLEDACEKAGMPFHDRQTTYLRYHREKVFMP